ncbi:MAG: putative phospholipid ABC transporter permease protein MlaE [Bacteroidetes bacterium ADurb.Bin397]|jgi:phospholipid/cholesterol/gamma-HCH transport system permease protein|nr:MAG: putative phospholipid ABC transporter permease protein MlaE [Bacteroidetes bacterium ADurb.Bin397]
MKSGKWIVFLEEVGAIGNFAGRFFREGLKPRYEWQELFRQCYIIGYKSLPLVGITAAIMGLVLTVQSRPTLAEFGAESWLPAMVAVSVVREIGPVITALICAGKIGSSIGAELGSMKVTEQIDAMEVSGTNPFKYLVVTRVMATTLMLPVLVIIADLLALYASYLGVNIKDAVSFKLYINQVFDALAYSDFVPAFVKSYFFGFAIGIVGCYKGYNSMKGTEGVGHSANSSVVISSLLIFVIDLIAVQFTDMLGLN